ncbi:TPA: MBL fold metallo-hydrolase [Vibrio alginolyticus]
MMKKHLYQAPAVNKKRYGDTVVTMLSDGYLDASFELLNGIEASQAEAALEQKGVEPLPRMNINAYVVETSNRTILIDSGAGGINGWGGRLPAALRAAGFDPLDIDTVLLTHAHPDHVGGLAGPLATLFLQMFKSFTFMNKNSHFGEMIPLCLRHQMSLNHSLT